MQAVPALDLSTIPAAQRAAVQALMETVAALTEITRRQEHLIADLNHALHGKQSEKLAEVEAGKETRSAKGGDGQPGPRRSAPSTTCRLHCRASGKSSSLTA